MGGCKTERNMVYFFVIDHLYRLEKVEHQLDGIGWIGSKTV